MTAFLAWLPQLVRTNVSFSVTGLAPPIPSSWWRQVASSRVAASCTRGIHRLDHDVRYPSGEREEARGSRGANVDSGGPIMTEAEVWADAAPVAERSSALDIPARHSCSVRNTGWNIRGELRQWLSNLARHGEDAIVGRDHH